MEPRRLEEFFKGQKARYGELFWYEQTPGRIVFMLEGIARKARELVGCTGPEIVSFETCDTLGRWYAVGAEQIDVEQRPSREEYQTIMDKDLQLPFTDLTNDIYQNQLVRVYQPQGYDAWCVVTYHSFNGDAPYGPIGWLKSLQGLKPLGGMAFQEPSELIPFEVSLKKFLGLPYRLGGGSFKNGFDCSSLAQRVVYETKGYWLPRKARWQRLVCDEIPLTDLQPGDLVFFNRKDNPEKEIDHVAIIYEANGNDLPKVFHAKRINNLVQIDDLRSVSWLDTLQAQAGWEINSFGRIKHPDGQLFG